ncbi:MAG: hypothetical protein ACI8TS_000906 [Flavobacteriales bacterium]
MHLPSCVLFFIRFSTMPYFTHNNLLTVFGTQIEWVGISINFNSNFLIMKQVLLSLGLSLFSIALLAQDAALVLFSENGELFTVLLNGEKQNEAPLSRVRCVDLNQEFYQVTVDFDDALLLDFKANFAIDKGMETTAIVKQNKKGKFVLRMFGSSPLSKVSVEPVAEYVPLAPRAEGNVIEDATQDVSTGTDIKIAETGADLNQGGIDIEMNVPGFDLKIKMDIPDEDLEMNSSYSEEISSSSTVNNRMSLPVEDEVIEKPIAAPSYNGSTGCDWPEDDTTFDNAIKTIEGKSFEDSKITLAKQIAKNKCLTAHQVMKVMMTFDFEASKLDFAKYAYDFTYDQGNYYVVNDAFGFELTIDELNDYLESK